MNMKRNLATLMAVACMATSALPVHAADVLVTGENYGEADTKVIGVVEPINTMEVTVPLNLGFIIRADRTLDVYNGTIQSDTAAPLDVKIISAEKHAVADPYNFEAPNLVAEDAFADWNNLSVSKTKTNINVEMNEVDLSAVTADGVNLGYIESAYGEDADGNFQSVPQYMDLEINQVNYGKAWDNTDDLVFAYDTVIEFSMLDTEDITFTSYDTAANFATEREETVIINKEADA